jgi:hypothetical protein
MFVHVSIYTPYFRDFAPHVCGGGGGGVGGHSSVSEPIRDNGPRQSG